MKRMQSLAMVTGAGVVAVLALAGCPPAEEGTSAPATATTTAEIGGGAGTAAASADPGTAAAPAPDPELMALCRSFFEKAVAACADDFSAMAAETYVKLDFPPGAGTAEKGKTPEGKKAVADGLKAEWSSKIGTPAADEACATVFVGMIGDEMRKDKAAIEACFEKADCKERVACLAPIEEAHTIALKAKMAAMAPPPAPGGAPATPPPAK